MSDDGFAFAVDRFAGLERHEHDLVGLQIVVRHAARLDRKDAGVAIGDRQVAERPHDEARGGELEVGAAGALTQVHDVQARLDARMASSRFITSPRFDVGHVAELVVQRPVDRVELIVDGMRGGIRSELPLLAATSSPAALPSTMRCSPAVTAAEIAAPSAGACEEPATSIGWPITSA